MNKNNRLVYSTAIEINTASKKFVREEQITTDTQKTDDFIKIHRQTKGRKGNGVSIITGLTSNEKDLKILAKKLKQKLGVGGSVKHGHIELQTNQRQPIKEYLQSQGYQVKIAGG